MANSQRRVLVSLISRANNLLARGGCGAVLVEQNLMCARTVVVPGRTWR
jgi:hypothetical protein